MDIELLAVGTAGRPPGVWAGRAPRRAHRRRSEERLVVFLTLESARPVPPTQVQALADRLAALYYRTDGPTTSAIRAVTDKLNRYLLQFNLKQSGQGQRAVGHLALAVQRGDRLVLALSGDGQAVLSGSQRAERFRDPESGRQGLGVMRATPLRFFQCPAQPGDLLVLTCRTAALHPHPGDSLDAWYRRLQAGDAPALILQFLAGKKGDVRWMEQPVGEAAQPQVATEVLEPLPAPGPDAPPEPESRAARPRRRRSSLAPLALKAGRTLRQAIGIAARLLGALLMRVLPAEVGQLPSSIMAALALLVPLVVVTVAAVVYHDLGQSRLYQQYFNEAQALALQAPALEDPAFQRVAWEAALEKIALAERYQVTDESQALRRQAQTALDAMNLTTRLAFEPVIVGGLPTNVQPQQMLVSQDELFVLDGRQGDVLRYTRAGALKYTLDADFACRGGDYAGLVVSPLVDMALLPTQNELHARLLAVDADGNLVYCGRSQGAVARALAPPTVALGTVRAVDFYQGDLFVLDPVGNNLYRYDGQGGLFDHLPVLVFDVQVPDLRQAVDLAVTTDDVYLLYEDGHMVHCTLAKTGDQQTRCEDPAHFQDRREGVQSDVLLADTRLTRLQYAPPPDPSLYLLDALHGAVMHFSLRLVYQEQFLPAQSLDEAVSAFAVGPDGVLFMATSHQVYAASRP